MKTLILIRHGEAQHNVSELTGGWSQTRLTENGVKQITLLADRLKNELMGIQTRIISSDLIRARETTQIINKAIGVQPEFTQGLRELNNGIAAGKSKDEVSQNRKDTAKPLIDYQIYPGAETWRTFHKRVSDFMESIDLDDGRVIIIVTHGGAIVHIISWWLRMNEEQLEKTSFHTDLASITVLDDTSYNERRVERLNDTLHLLAIGFKHPLKLKRS
jgi:probable phosphoglycerate mutase